MKIIAFTFLLLLNFACCLANQSISRVRALYATAGHEESTCKKLINYLNVPSKPNNALFEAYKGAATIIMAKHAFNPVKKLGYFNTGKKILEKAVQTDPQNIEIRFLRFTIQTNAPSFLGYNDNIRADEIFLQKNTLLTEDMDLKRMIVEYLKLYRS